MKRIPNLMSRRLRGWLVAGAVCLTSLAWADEAPPPPAAPAPDADAPAAGGEADAEKAKLSPAEQARVDKLVQVLQGAQVGPTKVVLEGQATVQLPAVAL